MPERNGAKPAPDAPVTGTPHGPPTFAFEEVPTRALAHLLNADPLPKLVTLTAPPGYGKTVLLGRLHRELSVRGWRCLWLTLDDRDAELSGVLFRLRAVLANAGGAAPEPESGLRGHFEDRAAPIDRMIQWLASLPGTTALFIDNLAFCTDPALAQLLARLVFSTPAGLHLMLSSTQTLPLDTVRAKLELGAVELQARHLSFDRDSTAQLLEQAGLTGASAHELDRIVAQTEGWAAAVRLVQVLLAAERDASGARRTPDIGALLQRFGGDHGDMAHVLTQRVLVGFEPELVRFMVEVALLREFNAELAMHMTGQPSAGRWLDRLVASNLLTFPLDSSRRWFRFHTLLREYLLAEAAEQLSSERRRELLERAARWHRDRGEHITAIGIALEAGATAMAETLLDRMAHVVVGNHGQMGSLIQWVDRLVQAGARPSPEVHAWYIWALCDSLQYERARRALDDFDRHVTEDPGYAGEEVRVRLRFLRIMVNVFIDRLDDVYDQARTWLASGATADALTVAAVISFAAIAETDRGELNAARQRMEIARATIARSDSAYGLAWVCILCACVEIGLARPDRADGLLRAGRESVVKVIGADASVVVTLDFVHARALLDLGQVAEARALAARGLPRALDHGIVGTLEHGLIASVAFLGGPGDPGIDAALLDRAANGYAGRGPALLAAARVRRLLELGRPVDAQAEASRAGLIEAQRTSDSTSMRERSDWLLAPLELMLAQGACAALLERIDALLKFAGRQGRERDRIELLLIGAEACDRLGQARQASRHFSMAVALAAPGGLIRPFKIRHGLMARLLASRDSSAFGLIQPTERMFLDRLRTLDQAETPPAAASDGSAAGSGLLNLRELQMLTLLDEGLNNEQLAARTALSVATVKWHLHNAYVKLGVRSRSAALARARALKLLSR